MIFRVLRIRTLELAEKMVLGLLTNHGQHIQPLRKEKITLITCLKVSICLEEKGKSYL